MADLEVSIHIDASPDEVWGLLGDPTRMGEWSPECQRVTWKGDRSAPAVGAKFTGHNRNGWRRWTTTGTVVDLTPRQRIAWDVKVAFLPIARWGYEITADGAGAGCTVVESFIDQRSGLAKLLGRPVRGVADVPAHNRRGMEATLAQVKAAAER
ncbi:MAG: SRPBCC family protein [Acidimicrobiales bacterium]